MPELGLHILQERKKRGWSQATLAEKVRSDPTTIYRWESGLSEPSPYFQQRLMEVFGWSEIGIIADTAATSLYWNVPYNRNPFFTGRTKLLARLHTLLQSQSTVILTHAITGLGGVGKTLLAVEYAYRYHKEREQRIYNAVFWAQASSQEALYSSFQAIAQLLALPEAEKSEQQIVIDAVHQWLAEHANWLLIFDNVEELRDIQPFLPPSQGTGLGHVLLTTRLQAGGTIVATKLDIEPMDLEEGSTFLLRRAKKLDRQQSLDQADGNERKVAEILCQEMAGLPLALDQAGAYIEETQCSLVRYLEFYQTRRASLLNRRGGLEKEEIHPAPVTVTFLLSLEKIAQANPAAADLLRFCAFLAPDDIPEDIFLQSYTALPSTLRSLAEASKLLEEAIALICRYSLLQRLTTKHAWSIHRVVQAVIQDDLTERGQRKAWEMVVVLGIAEAFAGANQENVLISYERYIPQALASIELIHQSHFRNRAAGHLLFLMGYYLTRSAQYERAEELCQEALELYQHFLGPDHPEIASNLVNLALLYDEKRLHLKTQLLLEQALAILQRAGQSESHAYAVALINLGRCYWFQGHYIKAESILPEAIQRLKQFEGTGTAQFAAGLSQFATLLRDRHKYLEAQPLYEQALHIHNRLFPPNRLSRAYCLEACATNDLYLKKIDLAESRYREALFLFEDIWGKDHPDVAGCLCRLADACFIKEKFGEAEAYNHRAWEIYEKVCGPDYLEINQPLQGLAMHHHYVKKEYDQAEKLYKQAISILENSQVSEHSDLVSALYHYSQLLWIKGERDEARKLVKYPVNETVL